MSLKRPKGPAGTLVVLEHSSKILKGNSLGDPHLRKLGFRIPFNAESGEAIEERWRNWRRHDPINLVAKYRANLKRRGPTRLDSSGGVYKCNPGELRVIHGAARASLATNANARHGG